MTPWTAAQHIVDHGRHAGHSRMEVWAALHYTEETGSVNEALRHLQEIRAGGAPPRWLIDRWARIADLPTTTNGHA